MEVDKPNRVLAVWASLYPATGDVAHGHTVLPADEGAAKLSQAECAKAAEGAELRSYSQETQSTKVRIGGASFGPAQQIRGMRHACSDDPRRRS